MIKTVINTFWQSAILDGRSFLNPQDPGKVRLVKQLISWFYFFVLLTSIQTFSPFYQFPEWQTLIDSQHLLIPNWSLTWMTFCDWETSVRAIFIIFFGGSLLGLIFWKRSRWARTLVFLSLFFYLSLISSFGKIDHYMHIMLVASFMLIFIPNENAQPAEKKSYFKVFFCIQAFILLGYFISGIFKLYGILDQEFSGLTSALVSESMALNLAKSSFASGEDQFLSSFILHNPSPLFSIFLLGGFIVEFFSIYVLFKPHLHRIWGLLLILLHALILVCVGPDFTVQIFAIGIFMLFSPFHPGEFDLGKDISQIWQRVRNYFSERKRKSEFIVYYDGDCMMCNRFLNFISKYDVPDGMRICKLQSETFAELKRQRPDLEELDSIVVAEMVDGKTFIRVKAKGITWVLGKAKRRFLILKLAYSISPFAGNLLYDLVARTRKKGDPDNCPIPPERMRGITVE